jgi:uncharacterized membrane protein YoaK (UPF0700 family)
MLSEAERRALERIELTLAADDPRFAEMLGSSTASRHARRERWAYDAVAVFSVLLGVACVALGQVGSGLLTLCFAVLVVMVRRVRYAAAPARPASRPGSSTSRP